MDTIDPPDGGDELDRFPGVLPAEYRDHDSDEIDFGDREELVATLEEFGDLINEDHANDVLMAYDLVKPMSMVNLFDPDPDRLEEFATGMERFFFVHRDERETPAETVRDSAAIVTAFPDTEHEVSLSRFRTLPEVLEVVEGARDASDLFGTLMGYHPAAVAGFVLSHDPELFE